MSTFDRWTGATESAAARGHAVSAVDEDAEVMDQARAVRLSHSLIRQHHGSSQSAVGPKSVQGKRMSASTPDVHDAAARGTDGPTTDLPFRERIQASFGKHPVGDIKAHVGGRAETACDTIGAEAYTTGHSVAFRQDPDLHTAAHEAAHVVQQRAGVQLSGGIGRAGDPYEHQADEIANRVVARQSAEPLLDRSKASGMAGQSTPAVQQKGRHKPSKQKEPTPVDFDTADNWAGSADVASANFVSAKSVTEALHGTIREQMTVARVHKEVKEGYKQASNEYNAAKRKSDLDQILEGFGTLVDIGTSVISLVGGVKALVNTAKGIKGAWETYEALEETGWAALGVGSDPLKETERGALKAVSTAIDVGKAGHGVVKGAGAAAKRELDTGATGPVDEGKHLADTNAAGLNASNDALRRYAEAQTNVDFSVVEGFSTVGAAHLDHVRTRLKRAVEAKRPIDPKGLAAVETSLAKAAQTAAVLKDAAERSRQLWKAYLAGGSMGLTDEKQFKLFDLISSWIRTGDPRAKALHVAADQDIHVMDFTGTKMDRDESPLKTVSRYCHKFQREIEQRNRGVVYVTDPKVNEELKPYVYQLYWHQENVGGQAQTELDERYPNAARWQVDMSTAQALKSLGVIGIETYAVIRLYVKGNDRGTIRRAQRGDWFDTWWTQPEFTAFWQQHLGEQYAYLWDEAKKERIKIPAADNKKEWDSTEITTHGQADYLTGP